jgi:integrase
MSIQKLPSGKYRAVVRRAGEKRNGAARVTRREAVADEAQIRLEMGAPAPEAEVTIDALLKDQIEQGRYAATTLEDLRRVHRTLPAPFLARTVSEVTPYVLDGLYRELTGKGWSAHRVRRVHELVGASYRQRAIPFRWATTNPARDVKPPPLPSHQIVPPTVAEVQRILSAAPTGLDLFLRVAANTGARRGEVLALQWQDFDLATGRVVIRRSVSHTPASGLVITEGKTGRKGHRSIGLGASIVQLLVAYRAEQERAASDNDLPEPRWLFSQDGGVTPWRPDYVTLAFTRLRKSLGLYSVRLHDLRHFVATSMLSDGVPLATVSNRLGHARTSTTLDRYSHWMPQQDQDAADRLDELFT